jgi:glycosyltransferase involved in cell wall biosynthesis
MRVNLTIFHYHLMPGGVTSVITQAVHSLRVLKDRVARIRVVAGRLPDAGPVLPGVEIVRFPEIGYAQYRLLDRVRGNGGAKELADELLKRFSDGDAVWWVHNYHLGKNPLFTESLLRLAELRDGPRIILQPHDFPEAGRYGNLSALEKTTERPLYPLGPRIRYALINSRDLKVLREAGVPESRLFLLENPVGPPAEETVLGEGRRGMRSLLFPDADPSVQTLLYPVRSIRRKNVLEAGMLLRLSDAPLRLVVTLPGQSGQEKAYSALVEDAFQSGLIPGEFGAGIRRSDLRVERFASGCDMVVSSSVQEGFGYLYVQALQWGLPIVARSLETAPNTDGIYDGYPAYLYGSLRCPIEASERTGLLSRYRRKARRISRLLRSCAAPDVEEEIGRILAEDAMDYSYLDPPLQKRYLEAAAGSSDFRSALRRSNNELALRFDALLSARPAARIQAIEKRFGLSAYASRIAGLLDSFERPDPDPPSVDPTEVQNGVRTAFCRAEYMRLLYD